MAILLNSDGKVDQTTQISDKVLDEKEYRRRILNMARDIGCLREMLILFNRIDSQMRNCRNDQERKDIAKLGVVEVYKLFGSRGSLEVDGQVVFKE